MIKAFLYNKLDGEQVQCRLCSHFCTIKPGRTGLCGVRKNENGTLVSLVYGRVIAKNIDPIEKKPLFNFLPGSLSYSVASVGCNLFCRHCQNSDISQMPRDRGRVAGTELPPDRAAAEAETAGCASISYTYTEPTVFGEYVFDTGQKARARGLKNVLVTNGFQSPEAVDKFSEVIDAANIDLKAFNGTFYRDICKAELEPVKRNIPAFKARGVWVEVTTLLIPGLNDSESELKALARFLADEAGPDTPWHISRFHPTYRLTDRQATPLANLERAYDIGLEAGLKYVYLGNVPGRGGENTLCPGCGKTVISRLGFTVNDNQLDQGRCPHCRTAVDGVYS